MEDPASRPAPDPADDDDVAEAEIVGPGRVVNGQWVPEGAGRHSERPPGEQGLPPLWNTDPAAHFNDGEPNYIPPQRVRRTVVIGIQGVPRREDLLGAPHASSDLKAAFDDEADHHRPV